MIYALILWFCLHWGMDEPRERIDWRDDIIVELPKL